MFAARGWFMRAVKGLATALAVLLTGALVSDPAFASRGGHRGGQFHGGHFKGHAGHFKSHGGHFKSHGGHYAKVHRGHFHKSRVVVGIGVGLPIYWGPWWVYPPPRVYYYPPPYYYPGAVGVPYSSPEYIERGDEQAAPSQWWYYCADSRTYYPYVKECPGGWQRVAPQPPAPR
jgi:hypothetical protein